LWLCSAKCVQSLSWPAILLITKVRATYLERHLNQYRPHRLSSLIPPKLSEICDKLEQEALMAETSNNLKLSPNSDDDSVKSSTPLYKKSKKKRDYDDMDRGHLGKKGRKGSVTSIASQTSEGMSTQYIHTLPVCIPQNLY
jgi:hypothetical protein